MKHRWTASRHEDLVSPGIPDVSFGIAGKNGWIELKVVRTISCNIWDIPNLTQKQRLWLCDRDSVGGNTWILVKSADGFLMIPGRSATEIGRRPLKHLAIRFWKRKIDWDDFVRIISK